MQSYFVDVCITGCRFKGSNYTFVYKGWNGSAWMPYCYCISSLTTFTVTLLTNCDLTCGGKDGERYSCGNSGTDWRYKSVYSNF